MDYKRSIIIIQRLWRIRKIRQKITRSKYQTKDWRLDQKWYKNGKSNECEKYQAGILYKLNWINVKKSGERLNMRTFKMKKLKNINDLDDGFEWTEDFDYKIDRKKLKNSLPLFINFKFVSDSGGAQTRTLREVYHFIKAQIEHLEYNDKKYFINILDGDASHKSRKQLKNLQGKFANIPFR